MKSNSQKGTNVGPGFAPIVFCDFDGTITQVDVTDQILTQLAHPAWQEVEQEWVNGSIGSRECLERQMALVEATAAELNALIDAIPVDPHFASFLRFTEKLRLPFYVVSDGFDYVIRRVLKQAGLSGPLRNGTHLFSSALRLEGRRLVPSFPHAPEPCEHGCATCKPAIIRDLGRDRHPKVFIGDGLSDRFAVEACDVVFAKRQLLAYCRAEGISCQPFETFAEIQESIEKLAAPSALESRAAKGRKSKVEHRKSRVLTFNY